MTSSRRDPSEVRFGVALSPLDRSPGQSEEGRSFLSVRTRFALAAFVSLLWLALTTWIALPWIRDLTRLTNWPIYPGEFEALVIDDASDDRTARVVESLHYPWLRLLRQPTNLAKSAALNRGLAAAKFDIIVTLDADSFLYKDALRNLVERYLSDPAGTMLVRNSRENWVTKAQEWDYFNGIAAIKRVQSFYHGTLVAQGAFSIYDREALEEVGGWAECVGEDIVLTWAMLARGWRIGHAEDACCFTNAPDTLAMFAGQRRRWARGMMEAFRRHPGILVVPRLSTLFVYWNVLFRSESAPSSS